MAYSSVKAMLNVSRQNNQPLWDVILQSDLLESGLTRPQSLAEMHHLWQVMVQTSDNYCGVPPAALRAAMPPKSPKPKLAASC